MQQFNSINKFGSKIVKMIPQKLSSLKISILIAFSLLVSHSLCAANSHEKDLEIVTTIKNNNDTQIATRSSHQGRSMSMELIESQQANSTNMRGKSSATTRAGRMLDLDRLAGEVGSQVKAANLSGARQSRRLAPNGASDNIEGRSKSKAKSGNGKKLAIQGFIPIISLEGSGSGKDGKQLSESLAEHFASHSDSSAANDQQVSASSSSSSADNDDETTDSEQQQQQQQANHLREHLASNFGSQTSIGHASFAQTPNNYQQQQQQQQWQQLNNEQQQEQNGARARKLLSTSLFSGHRQGLRPLVGSGNGLLSNFIQTPNSAATSGTNYFAQQNNLNGPMNLPQQSGNYLTSAAAAAATSMPQFSLASNNNFEQFASEQCICVPFFQCKNGFLSESQLSKSQLSQISLAADQMIQIPRSNDNSQQQQQRQQILSQPNDQQMVNDIYEQLKKNIESQNLEKELQQNQRTLSNNNEPEQFSNKTNVEKYLNEERSLLNSFAANINRRQSASGARQCGIMRACCKIPPHLLTAPPAAFNSPQPIPMPQVSANNNFQSQPTNLIQLSSSSFSSRPQFQQQQQQQHSARFIQRPQQQQQQPQYQIISPHRSQQVQQFLVQQAQNHQQFHQQPLNTSPAPMSPLLEQSADYLIAPSQAQQSFQQPNQHLATLPTATSSLIQTEQQQRPNFNNHNHNQGQLMSGRCGLRQTLGISGRVQNSQAQAHGEQTNSEFGEFPAHAAILKRISPGDSLFVCSAVLLSTQWLATAAHCVKKLRAEDLKVRLGEWDVSRDDEFYPHVESNVREIILHPDFQASSLINDLALIRLENSVGSNEQMPHISPACLAQPEETFAGQRCWVAGWGKDAFGQSGTFQSTLRKVDLPVVAHDDCELALKYQTKLGKYFRLHQNNICAGGERGKDACEGDGGAGLYCVDQTSGLSKAVGLVSWGVGCGQRGVPGVYVSLAQYNSWIEQVISSSGEENVYNYSDNLLGGRQQQQASAAAADSFKGIISERSNEQQQQQSTNETIAITNSTTTTTTTSTTTTLPQIELLELNLNGNKTEEN